MKKTKIESGVLTELMDVGTEDFKDFQAFILSKANSRTLDQQLFVELMALKFKMEDYLDNEESNLISIGVFLKTFLDNTNIKQNRFANYIGLRPSNFSKLLNGERRINLEIAIMLESILGVDAKTILGIQTKNELMSLTLKRRKELSQYSIKELIKKS